MSFSQGRLKPALQLAVVALVASVVLSALPQHAAPQTAESQLVLKLDPAQSNVRWILGSSVHTVHGTFSFKQGNLQVDPASGKVSGEIVADATSGNSGNDSRDKKMHKDVLESARFSEVIFRPDSFTGKLASQEDSTVEVHGIFVLHGSEHELTVPAKVTLAGDHWTGSANFSVPFIDWGLKNPGNWLLKVEHVVKVELELKGTLQSSNPTGH
jgi:polyisoprenoid-binding protein YceI